MMQLLTRCARTAFAVSLMSGCGQSAPGRETPTGAGDDTAATADAPDRPQALVKTASVPSDACGWIPASEVEQVVGALEGPPRPAGNECIYPLVQKSPTFAKWLETRRQFRKGGDDGDHDFHDVVKVSVDLKGSGVIAELTSRAVGKMFAKELGQPRSDAAKKDPPPPGWDSVGGMPYTWMGRVGHVSIAVFSPPEISNAQQMALATRVRDRIPDLPFAAENADHVPTLGAGDRSPCDLLTRAEAEAVLGTLVVDPYRATDHSPLADGEGDGCAYYTSGHRVLIVTPEWSDGEASFNMSSGLGGLLGIAAPLENAAIEGPWDKGQVDGITGALLFLKGDRLLRVDYLMSSADRAGALRLAAHAVQRLASISTN